MPLDVRYSVPVIEFAGPRHLIVTLLAARWAARHHSRSQERLARQILSKGLMVETEFDFSMSFAIKR